MPVRAVDVAVHDLFLRGRTVRLKRPPAPPDGKLEGWLRGSRLLPRAARSLIFEVVTRLLFGVMMVVSVYLLLAGHNLPGGGFAGGLVAGTALLVRYLAAGGHELDEAMPLPAGAILGTGLAVAVATAVAFVSGMLAIVGLLRYLRTRTTLVFVVYRLGLGVLLLALLHAGRLRPDAGLDAPVASSAERVSR